MLLLDIEHYFSLHLRLSFQTLLGLAHLILVRAGLACEFRADRVFLIKCLILLLSHLNWALGVLVDLKEFDLLGFNIIF